MKKIVFFAFEEESMCFAHVLLNALDLYKAGYEARVVIEGMATKTVAVFRDETKPFAALFYECKEKGILDSVCLACSKKTGSYEALKDMDLPFSDELSGHPSMKRFLEEGYEIVRM